MIKINEIIKNGAQQYADSIPDLKQDEAIELMKDFMTGADFVVENILALPNQFPLKAVISIQTDPNDKEAQKLSVKSSGMTEPELIDTLLRFIQSRLTAHGTKYEVMMIPHDEAVRMKAFKESLALVKDRGKLKLD
ncbi:MAG: hypothetical protein KGZ74_06545 [Chitinophagaceae bacterium]|nr:hypothetical protein [Chitinophagaceae bacterium]